MIQSKALPASFSSYVSNAKKPKFRRLMIGTQGGPNTGKSEFIMSAPGPGINVCLDYGYEAMTENPEPPEARQGNILCVPYFLTPNMGSADVKQYATEWTNFQDFYLRTLNDDESITSGLDGGTELYETLRLAVFERLEQVPQIRYTQVNALMKAFCNLQFKSGKNIIQTHKMKKKYIVKLDVFGKPVMDSTGKSERVDSGEFERQGFDDHEYLWMVQLEHKYQPGTEKTIQSGMLKGKVQKTPGKFGFEILRCKINKNLEGTSLWGSDANFQGLVKAMYPNVPLAEWGY